jgi:hypothetical protein
MMAKKTQETQESQETQQDQLEEVIKEARSTPGATPQELKVMVREFTKMLEAVRMSRASECYIGTYFVPMEGQPGIEGLVNAGADLITKTISQGWQPWSMGTPYFGKYAFNFPNGQSTGALDGQWLTIVFLKPAEE